MIFYQHDLKYYVFNFFKLRYNCYYSDLGIGIQSSGKKGTNYASVVLIFPIIILSN